MIMYLYFTSLLDCSIKQVTHFFPREDRSLVICSVRLMPADILAMQGTRSPARTRLTYYLGIDLLPTWKGLNMTSGQLSGFKYHGIRDTRTLSVKLFFKPQNWNIFSNNKISKYGISTKFCPGHTMAYLSWHGQNFVLISSSKWDHS